MLSEQLRMSPSEASFRTPPAAGSPAPSAAAFGCRPSRGTRRWQRRASARSRYSLRIHLLVFQGFHERFAGRVVPRIAFAGHADVDAVVLQQVGVIARWHTARRDRNDAPDPADGCRCASAMRSAVSVSSSSSVRSSAQPITRREKASRITARIHELRLAAGCR